MAMDKINGFTNLSKELLERFRGSGRTDSKDSEQSADVRAPVRERRAAPADKADISAKAHRLIALRHAVDSGLRALEALPEVRQERMAQVRTRLGRGYYNSVEVRALVADRLNDVALSMEDL